MIFYGFNELLCPEETKSKATPTLVPSTKYNNKSASVHMEYALKENGNVF